MGSLKFEVIDAGVVESVDTSVLKTEGETRAGSSPVPGTISEDATVSFEIVAGGLAQGRVSSMGDTFPAPVWDTTRDEKDYCNCGERSDTLYQGNGFCDHHWYEWLCEDRGYDVDEPEEDSRFVKTIFI